jgi:hypothetical protein
MIFGYISKEEPTWIESYIKEKYPNGVEIACQYKEGRAWFFTNNAQFDFCQYYEDESRVLLFEGIPIIGSSNTGYKIIDAIRKSVRAYMVLAFLQGLLQENHTSYGAEALIFIISKCCLKIASARNSNLLCLYETILGK